MSAPIAIRDATRDDVGLLYSMVQALAEYEAEVEERAFLRDVVQGLMDLEEGRETDLLEVKQRLGLD